MDKKKLIEILDRYKNGEIKKEDIIEYFSLFPFKDEEFLKIDLQRELRKNSPEIVYGQGKTLKQLLFIIEHYISTKKKLLITKVNRSIIDKIKIEYPKLFYSDTTGIISSPNPDEIKLTGRGKILIVTAGSSDIPIAEEAYITSKILGNKTEKLYDVGVAGLNRLLLNLDILREANVIVAIAGMEGALPSVIGGLVNRPVIAVPTSIGYGANFGGISALLSMLNSCSSSVSTVNIDNGFGGAYFASLVNH